ncbi:MULTISPECIES: ParB/RepB/Spo0J family partition protein [unclassified Streptomyces]|uniref:ParB/RepB/Spo0J family partition protein n=1 Tax=Streptomyces TaxID=1883 RepID=UPI001367B93B|nr:MULTISPECIES: ParB/RepB/Spo0J family partition protein [unclassified Streptomyces]NEA04248.1 ParB/RepB/Spo0J family partition protein [Streptomyces sp. SID10116]MYY83960.1 ParB/RepB/Spo0J family partition protein [Streptomyces sp. SID335]MYZ12138.1 ParB/RepB/Spo0J family partition protein [Streptomyces sp. SID337]NDZ84162.1 ParB/RepB/Spo0J family partition protein [Streptomyces sp. SID10115]NEB44629.1 ParB/RepB/Spo0J family partition protein [Streptomyces sp. SID339]
MSKADQLGAGRFGAGSISTRRAAIGAATGVPTAGVAPPTKLPVGRISLNPDNPRTSLGDLTELGGSLKEHGQKQAITVMNRDAYVKANPQHEKDLEPDTTHVVVDGSSRLAAAREAGVTHLKVMVDDDQGADADELLESALVANVHRQALEPLDEAQALQRLLAIHGTQTALAKRLHKSQGWVSQRLALLNLTPELKERVGQEPVDLLRAVGNKPADQQEAALEKLKQQQALEQAEKAERKRQRNQQKQSPPVPEQPIAPQPVVAQPVTAQPAVEQPSPAEPAPTQPTPAQPAAAESPAPAPSGAHYDVIGESAANEKSHQPETPAAVDSVPEPRASRSTETDGPADEEAAPPRLPYNDGYFIAQHLIRKMPESELDKMLALLNEHQQQRNAANANA